MKDKIEIGEYIRTKNGIILKADFIDYEKLTISQKGVGFDFEDIEEMSSFIEYEIVKHSKNIIDLIEAGDIIEINDEKYEVIYDESYKKLGILIPNRKELAVRHCAIEYIFSKNGIEEFKNIKILTKEQFNQNCCEVEE